MTRWLQAAKSGNPTGTKLTEPTKPRPQPVLSVLSVLSEGEKTELTPPDALETAWAEIETLPLLAEDHLFIRERIRGRLDAPALMARYAVRWRAAPEAEPVAFRKANRGRFAANNWLLRATERDGATQT
jgi:hypothetical protein